MPDGGVVKYLVKIRFEVNGLVEKADVIGAIFGQTEGLFGPEMNLNELQKSWKVGRIEINLHQQDGRSQGEVSIPMSTDISMAALIAAAIESIEKVGPFQAKFHLSSIDDVRAIKKKAITERAKEIIKEWASRTSSEGEELLKDLTESLRRAKLISYGKEGLPAGPGIYTSDHIILVEGRADVINLLRAGIENVVAIEGSRMPESVMKLVKGKKVTAFLDGDHAGDLILKELQERIHVDRVVRAPPGKEVEDLTPLEVLELLKPSAPQPGVEKPKPKEEGREREKAPAVPEDLLRLVKDLYPEINGTLEAILVNGDFANRERVPVNELIRRIESSQDTRYVILDGIVTQRLVDVASKAGVQVLIAHRKGEIRSRPPSLIITTFKELGIE